MPMSKIIQATLNWPLAKFLLRNKQTILLIGGTILVHNVYLKLRDSILSDGIRAGFTRQFYKLLQKLPPIRNEIRDQMALTTKSLESNIGKLYTASGPGEGQFILEIPVKGLPTAEILRTLEKYMSLGEYSLEEQRLSGATYYTGEDITELYTSVYKSTLWSNPLHYEVYPGICKMEAELVRMACKLFGDSTGDCCGTITSGGTESILLAVKAYRDYARDVNGIQEPEILVPITAHAAFNKAAQLLGIKIRQVQINMKTCAVDLDQLRKMISKNTCMIVGSAPAYPHGCMDNIMQIANIGRKLKIPVHVDACLGGFLLAFMVKAGYGIQPFDFCVDGVTSISADTHKYGFSPKGSSVLLFRENKYRRYQYFTEANWPGGLYASSTLAGSKCGASIAACWASFLHFGTDGYVESTRKIIETAKFIKERTKRIQGLDLVGDPMLSVIAWSSTVFDIYALYDAMNKKGWTLNALQFPPAIHICISYPQTKEGIPARFVRDMEKCVKKLINNTTPGQIANEGAAAIYGSSQKVPFRELVNETTSIFLDTLYKTSFD